MTLPARLRSLSGAGFFLFIVLLAFEGASDGPRAFLLAAASLLLLAADAAEGRLRLWRTARVCTPLIIAPLVAGALLLYLASPAEGAREEIPGLIRRPALFLLLAPALALRLLERGQGWPAKLILFLPLACGYWWLMAACQGVDPHESLRMFYKEAGLYLTAYYLALNLGGGDAARIMRWGRAQAGVIACCGLAAVLLMAAAHLGPESWVGALDKAEWIRADSVPGGGRLLRAQLTFDSHNRLASYLLVGLLLIPAAWPHAGGLRAKAAAGAGMLVIGMGMLLSGTRGAVIAGVAGLALPLVTRPKMIPVFIAAGIAAAVLLPSPMRAQMRTIFDPATYTRKDGNVQLRVEAWKNALEMSGDRPLLGFGYGWTLFEDLYKQYNRPGEDIEDKPHAHNNLLEITAESGVIGGGLFALYQALLLAVLAREILRSRAGSDERWRLWAALGLWFGLNLFGMSNYSLRRTVGAAVWLGWAFAAACAAQAASGAVDNKRGGPESEPPPVKP